MSEDIRTQYDRIGGAYLEARKEFIESGRNPGFKFIISQIPWLNKGMTHPSRPELLDVGCGDGKDIEFYLRNNISAYGVEPSEFMVQEAQRRAQEADNSRKLSKRVVIGSAEAIPFPDRSFDIVSAEFSMHYIKGLDSAYGEIARVLRPRGQFIFVVHHPLFDFLSQQEKVYGNGEIRETILFGRVPIKCYSHTVTDYLSPTFLRNFDLRHAEEIDDRAQTQIEGYQIPDIIGISAVRRQE